ncbi:hypothetical protein KBI33_02955 [Candidatus Shapirobacteria bacterium]|nr:hypothetical protein [Candidatus Shapirobacteria bacterium]
MFIFFPLFPLFFKEAFDFISAEYPLLKKFKEKIKVGVVLDTNFWLLPKRKKPF